MRHRYAVLGAVSLLLLAGCSDDKDAAPKKSAAPSATASAKPSAPPRAAFDPPTRFGPQGAALPAEASESKISVGGTTVEPLPVALHETTAFIASTASLLAVDTDSGRTLATITPKLGAAESAAASPWVGSNPSQAPVLWTDNGRAIVLTTFIVQRPASGTQKAGRGVEVVAVDAETTTTAWTTSLNLPAGLDQGYAPLAANPIGVDGNRLAVGVRNQDDEGVIGVDLTSRREVWSRADFRPGVVSAGVVAGATGDPLADRSSVVALNLADGKQRWTALADSQQLTVSTAGPTTLIATGKSYSSQENRAAFLDVATGKARQQPAGDYSGARCWFDGKDVTVCARDGWAAALDATTAKVLWQLPDTANTRVAPRVTAVWHGAVYGSTDNGPVVLDARSGQDREISPGLAPMVVNEYVGIGQPPNGGSGVRAYRAAK